MRALLQRVKSASVRVDGEVIAEIGPGLLVLLGVAVGDGGGAARWLADKIAALRIFADDEGRMNRSVLEVGGAVLAVSQFTLYADTRKGRRPSFVEAQGGEGAEALYQTFLSCLRETGVPVETGRFGADMQVALINDGPVTIIVDSPRGT
jgi:D-tyrosyl-tRNA(Tyr) deacylase